MKGRKYYIKKKIYGYDRMFLVEIEINKFSRKTEGWVDFEAIVFLYDGNGIKKYILDIEANDVIGEFNYYVKMGRNLKIKELKDWYKLWEDFEEDIIRMIEENYEDIEAFFS